VTEAATSGRLAPDVATQLVELHARSTIKKGQASTSAARRTASRRLWELVDQQYRAGVSSQELGAVMGVQDKTVLAQLRSHGFLGGPSPSQRLVRGAAGDQSKGRGRPTPRLEAAADRVRRARDDLDVAKAEAAAAFEELREAVLAEHAASHASSWVLSVQAGVTVKMVRRWLETGGGADPGGPAEPATS